MTTETTLTSAQLIKRHLHNQQVIDQMAQENHAIEVALKARMQEVGATVLAEEGCQAELSYPSPTYALERLRDVLELVPEDVRAKGFTPAHEEVVQIPDKFNMVQVKTWVKYGRGVAVVIEDAKMPGEPRLRISGKE